VPISTRSPFVVHRRSTGARYHCFIKIEKEMSEMKSTSWIRSHRAATVAMIVLAVMVGAGAAYAGSARHAAGGRGVIVNAITSELGITRAQLRADLAGGQTLAQIAGTSGVSVTALENAITIAAQSRLDRAVAAGLLTPTQEQTVLSRLDARIGTLVNVQHPAAHIAFALRLRAAVVRLSARYLGVAPTALRADLRSGQTLAQLASANGKTASGLEQAVVNAVKTRLDQAVAAGNLTTQDETTVLGNLQTRLDQAVNHNFAP
jgi:hypothetical protein